MQLNRLELTEFQKHKHLIIEFCDGVNILYGSSDSGKSCIRRAIEFLCDFNVCDGIRKTGSKTTSVKGWFSNEIIITRIRSVSINRYILEKNGKEIIFDSIGRSAPKEIIDAIGILPLEIDGKKLYLNSHPQISLPFLFDISPSDRAKILNKLTGNNVLDKLFGEFNKDILRIKRNKKEEIERFENRIEELKNKKVEKEKAEAIHSRLRMRINKIKESYQKYSKLLELKELQIKTMRTFSEVNKRLKNLNFPQPEAIKELTEKIEKFEQLSTHKNTLEKTVFALNRVRGQIKDLKPLSVNLSDLRGNIERFTKIKAISEKFSQNSTQLSQTIKNQKINNKEYEVAINAQTKLLKEMKICPTCNQEIK